MGIAFGMMGNGSIIKVMAYREPDLFGAIFYSASGRHITGPDLTGALAERNAVFVGEQHDDPLTHHAELRLLTDLHDRVGDRLTLGLEMFERDGQAALDDYLANRIDETELGKRVALWSNYPTDYRPLVEFARTHRIPVLATNAPQRIVRRVGREGWAAVQASLGREERSLVAANVIAPHLADGDAYARRFAEVIGAGHGNGKPMDAEMVRRFFEAQCVRDATMAESVAHALDAGRFVLHINGGFHSDAGLGTVQRLLWHRPLGTRVGVVNVVPYRGKFDPAAQHGEGDFLLYVPDTRPIEAPEPKKEK